MYMKFPKLYKSKKPNKESSLNPNKDGLNDFDREYHKLLKHILKNGDKKGDRTGVGTISVFGYQMRFDLSKGFPLLTTKKVFYKGIFHELLWFLRGDTNIRYLCENKVGIWNEWPFQNYLKENKLEKKFPKYSEEWKEEMKNFVSKIISDNKFAKKWGELGPVYGKQWRDFNGVDQIKDVIEQIKTNPNSRRLIVSAWNANDVPKMVKSGLPPCHCLYQFYVNNGKLSTQLYQRSCDTFLGVPFNIASYSLLIHIIAKICDLEVGEFVWTGGDVHIYLNHIEQVKEQLSRKSFKPPKLIIKNRGQKKIEDFKFEDFEITNYKSQPVIKAPIAV